MRILIVDDDELLCESLKDALESENHIIDLAHDGEKGSFLARTNSYSLVILDNMMPKKTGSRVCQEIRNSGKSTPILMLSIQNAIQSKVAVLDNGADDYLSKPFSYDELRARVKALLRRPVAIEPNIWTVGDLTLDIDRQRVTRGSKLIYLTRKEFSLLEYLMKNKSRIVSRAMITENVWGEELNPFSNTIETHMLNLRKKVDGSHKEKLIRNMPGRGYTIDDVN